MGFVIGLIILVGLAYYFFGKKEDKKEDVKNDQPQVDCPKPVYFDPLSDETLIQNQTVELEILTKNGHIIMEVNRSTKETYKKSGMTTFVKQKKSKHSGYPNKVYNIKRAGWGGVYDEKFFYYEDQSFYNIFGYYPLEFMVDTIIDSAFYSHEARHIEDDGRMLAEEHLCAEERLAEGLCTEEQRNEDLCVEHQQVVEPEIIEEERSSLPEYPEERSRGIFDSDSETHKVFESSYCSHEESESSNSSSRVETLHKEESTYVSETVEPSCDSCSSDE